MTKPPSSKDGYLYILSNPSMPDLFKIGMTTKSIKERVKELHATGVAAPFNIEFGLYVSDCQKFEKEIHGCFAGHRVANNREFFSVELREAIVYILDYYLDQKDIEDDTIAVKSNLFKEQQRLKDLAIEQKKEDERPRTTEELAEDEAEKEMYMADMRRSLGLDSDDT